MIALLRDRGDMAIVLVEQYFDFAFDLADEITVLRRGEVIFEGAKASTTREEVLPKVSV